MAEPLDFGWMFGWATAAWKPSIRDYLTSALTNSLWFGRWRREGGALVSEGTLVKQKLVIGCSCKHLLGARNYQTSRIGWAGRLNPKDRTRSDPSTGLWPTLAAEINGWLISGTLNYHWRFKFCCGCFIMIGSRRQCSWRTGNGMAHRNANFAE
jgi:hypothetical protein